MCYSNMNNSPHLLKPLKRRPSKIILDSLCGYIESSNKHREDREVKFQTELKVMFDDKFRSFQDKIQKWIDNKILGLEAKFQKMEIRSQEMEKLNQGKKQSSQE